MRINLVVIIKVVIRGDMQQKYLFGRTNNVNRKELKATAL